MASAIFTYSNASLGTTPITVTAEGGSKTKEVVVTADDGNTNDVLIDATYPIFPGSSVTITVDGSVEFELDVAAGTETVHIISDAQVTVA